MLEGARGHRKSDVDSAADVLVRLSNFALATELLSEVDINPLMVLSEGEGAWAADALVTMRVP